MNPVKVGLVQINNSFSDACYFPYTVGVLQAYFLKYGKNPDSFEFLEPLYRRVPLAEAVSQLEEAEIVAFSVYVWNFKLSLEIAKRVKEIKPNVLILFGGAHVPGKSETFLRKHPFIDLACHGEGEMVFLKILENYHSRKWERVPSISYLDNNTFDHHPRALRIRDLSTIPSPYLEGVFDTLVRSTDEHQWLGLWETNRGCPFSCTYCDWGANRLSKLYTFEMKRLEREIEWFAKNKIEFIFCCDANFGILDRDLDIVRCVADTKRKYGYPKALSVQSTKNATERSYAIQKVLSGAQLNKGVNLALQTLDKTTLKNVRRQNISLESFRELQRRFGRDGVETFTDLILGLPGETYDSFTNGVTEIIENGQHHRIQFINLSILPNSQMADLEYRERFGLLTVETRIINIHGSSTGSEEGIYETQELVVGTNTMPKDDWIRARIFSWMTSFVYFDKMLQIPFILLHEVYGLSFRELVELFLGAKSQYPVISEISTFFTDEARNIQKGGPEFYRSEDWLNIYWPHDEYILIKLCVENKLERFYEEAEKIISKMLQDKYMEPPLFLKEACVLNRSLLKQPFQTKDLSVSMEYNIWDFYQSVLTERKCALKKNNFVYHIDRTSEVWHNWEDWFKKVVWYGNKKGAYLNKITRIERAVQAS